MTLLEALRDPNLFARHFRAKSWAPWRTYLRALTGEAPVGDDFELFQACTGRTSWPGGPFLESSLIVGRRGGKSRTLALIAVFLACFRDYTPYLAPGEVATIGVLAANRSQARVIFRFVLGLIKETPLLAPMVVRHDTETIQLINRVQIEIATASFRTARGYSFAAVLCDEIAFWYSDEASANPDREILRALRPGLANIPGAMLLIASSPYAKKGELYSVYRRHYGRDDARTLVWKAATEVMNASIDRRIIAEAYEDDPESARAEYGAEFRDDLADYVTLEVVEAVTCWGRLELPPIAGVAYSGFYDSSGGRSDAMTLAIGHLDSQGRGILDAVSETRPPFDPGQALVACAELCRRYGVVSLISDKYAGEWPVARFRELGVELTESAKPKSDIYGDFLPLLNGGRVELLDLPRLRAQLVGLERKTARSGKDSIDHAPGGHDDLCNVVAGCLVGLDLDRRPPLIRLENLIGADVGLSDGPTELQRVFAVIVDEGVDLGVVYCGADSSDRDPACRLYVLDADTLYYQPGVFGGLREKLRRLRLERHAVAEVMIVPEDLAAQIGGAGFATLPRGFDPEQYIKLAAERIARGLVRFCAATIAKMKTRAIGAALSLKAGDPVETALRSALISAIWANAPV
jgi:hypothetical protein